MASTKEIISKTIEDIQSRLDAKHLMLCDSEYCAWNPNGVCLCGAVTGKIPEITDDGCTKYLWKE